MGETAENVFDDDAVCDYCGNRAREHETFVNGLCTHCRRSGIMPVEQMLSEYDAKIAREEAQRAGWLRADNGDLAAARAQVAAMRAALEATLCYLDATLNESSLYRGEFGLGDAEIQRMDARTFMNMLNSFVGLGYKIARDEDGFWSFVSPNGERFSADKMTTDSE
jgi:hypothetical protein